MTRTDALVAIDAAFPADPIVVNVGAAIREMVAAVGYKHNRWLDVVLMQRTLGPGAGEPPRG